MMPLFGATVPDCYWFPVGDGNAGAVSFIGFVVGYPVGFENRSVLLGGDNNRGKICGYLPGGNQYRPTSEEDDGRCNS